MKPESTTDLYRCHSCELALEENEVNHSTNKCPKCNTPISFKILFDGDYHCINKLKPSEVKNGMQLTLDYKNAHTVLNVTNTGNNYRIALEGFGVLKCDEIIFRTIINGSWYD